MAFTLHDERIPVWGTPDAGAVEQIVRCAQDAQYAALMADHHLGYAVPIGGVVAYDHHISPSGVGYDIACGNKAVRLDLSAADLRRDIGTIMDEIWSNLSFGVGRVNSEEVDHELFDDDAWSQLEVPDRTSLKDKARRQLGTIGSGNHYVDLFVDERERVWVGVHFGSRGFGHRIATHYITAGGGSDGMQVKPVLLDVDSDLGRGYLLAMELAGRYAYAGRDWVCGKVASLLGAAIEEEVHNHHNFAWREEHDGRQLWVVRKGATPAFPGQKGFVGGSMGDTSVILRGAQGGDVASSDEARRSLYSTVHGAGRVMSRRQAAGKTRWDKKRRRRVVVRPGAVSRAMMMEWVRERGVELRGAGTDESPHCYKRISDVLAAHAATIEVLHTLRPLGVAMAAADEHDPYRD